MTDDIRQSLDSELPEGSVPFDLDAAAAVAAGRRARGRRRLLIGGSGFLSIVTAGALLVAGLAPGDGTADEGDHSPAGIDDSTPAGTNLPELDPDVEYSWGDAVGFERSTTEQTQSYTNHFWRYFNAEFPQGELDTTEYTIEGQPEPAQPEEPPFFQQQRLELRDAADMGDGVQPGPIHSQPLYSLTYRNAASPALGDGETMTYQFGDKMPNFIDIDIHPAGGFSVDTGDLFDLARCPTDAVDGVDVEMHCTIDEASGPDGERVQNVQIDTVKVESDKAWEREYRTIVYRNDGTAVVVSDDIRGRDGGAGSGKDDNVEGQAPYLSFEDLEGIALALPSDPVE